MSTHNLLAYRFILANLMAGSLMAGLWAHGVIWPLFEQDSTYISHGIVALFIVAWFATARQVVRMSRLINLFKKHPTGCGHRDKIKALAKIAWLRDVSSWLVALGLMGTIIGLAVAISSINQSSLGSAGGAQTAVGQLMSGMRIAVNTTICGAVAALWNEVNVRMLWTAAEVYWTDRTGELIK